MATPLQQLVRLREIGLQLSRVRLGTKEHEDLLFERSDIMASVGVPPLELLGDANPEQWAQAFAEHFTNVAAPTAYAWFSNAILAGFASGQEQGRREAAEAHPVGVKAMADLLAFIRVGVDSGRIRCPFLVDPLDAEGMPAVGLADMIDRRLSMAGLQ